MEYIYKITSPSKKSYIGRAHNIKVRMVNHKHDAFVKQSQYAIHKAIRKYGIENMEVDTIDKTQTIESALILEGYYIRKFDTVRTGYNETYCTGGGDIWADRYDTSEFQAFLEKMSQMNMGDKNPMYGRKHTESARAKQKAKAKGRFSLPWFVERNGKEEGTKLYEERCEWLRSRKLPKDEKGRFYRR